VDVGVCVCVYVCWACVGMCVRVGLITRRKVKHHPLTMYTRIRTKQNTHRPRIPAPGRERSRRRTPPSRPESSRARRCVRGCVDICRVIDTVIYTWSINPTFGRRIHPCIHASIHPPIYLPTHIHIHVYVLFLINVRYLAFGKRRESMEPSAYTGATKRMRTM
jgi:hypothetical protein